MINIRPVGRPFALLLCLLGLSLGCKRATPVSVERIPKDRSGIQWMRDLGPAAVADSSSTVPTGASSVQPAQPSQATRMVVAIFQRSDAAWFFKITGSPEKVASTQSQWQPFLNTVRFESKSGSERPVWELPDPWSDGGKAQMVFAILKMAGSDLEVRISRLGGQQDLLSNVNRWRGQLGLPPATSDSLDQQLTDQQSDHASYRLFDQKGQSTGKSMGGPFMRSQAMGTVPSTGVAVKTENSAAGQGAVEPSLEAVQSPLLARNELAVNPKFTLDAPVGYELGKTSAMVVARYVKQSDKGKVQISVVPLTAINRWDDNVNFWRQSVGLQPATADEIESMSQAVSVSGIDGKMIKLLSDASVDQPSLIGVMIKRKDAAWFFKMMGDRDMVAEDQSVFDAFLQSFQFKPSS